MRPTSILFVLILLVCSIMQSSAATTSPDFNTQDFPIIDLHLADNDTLTINLILNFSWDEDRPEPTSQVIVILNDSEIDRFLPDNGTQHLVKSIHVSGINPGNYRIQIKQYDYSIQCLIAVNYSAAILLTSYGAGFIDDVDYFIVYSADTFVSGRLYYFGKDNINCTVDIKEGPRVVKEESLNLAPGASNSIGYSETPSTVAMRKFTIGIKAGELSIFAGPFEVNQKPYSRIGNFVFTPCCMGVIILLIIFIVLLILLIFRRIRKGPITFGKKEPR